MLPSGRAARRHGVEPPRRLPRLSRAFGGLNPTSSTSPRRSRPLDAGAQRVAGCELHAGAPPGSSADWISRRLMICQPPCSAPIEHRAARFPGVDRNRHRALAFIAMTRRRRPFGSTPVTRGTVHSANACTELRAGRMTAELAPAWFPAGTRRVDEHEQWNANRLQVRTKRAAFCDASLSRHRRGSAGGLATIPTRAPLKGDQTRRRCCARSAARSRADGPPSSSARATSRVRRPCAPALARIDRRHGRRSTAGHSVGGASLFCGRKSSRSRASSAASTSVGATRWRPVALHARADHRARVRLTSSPVMPRRRPRRSGTCSRSRS